jgi:hypothetical protein
MQMDISIREQAILACRRLLSQLNRDPATPAYGCFDRRYWAWKLVDFPEATFQRNIHSLCWFMDQPEAAGLNNLAEFIRAGILYAIDIQHKDGSFDQAYPNEHSYGATAFLLPDLITTYQKIKEGLLPNERILIENRLMRSADFLYKASELHGFIANHLAGAALALLKSYQLFGENKYKSTSNNLVNRIIESQSDEGWFQEYSGADPGYQTLCMYYLAQIFTLEHSEKLHNALEKSLQFLQFFIHPDGTFGGEYGSRRTEIYYPGGIAILSQEFPVAAEMHTIMKESIRTGTTVNLIDIDMGNLAPLLSNYTMAASIIEATSGSYSLPYKKKEFTRVFKSAGLAIIATPAYYAILGISNGGVLKVFNKKTNILIYDDCGLLGETSNGKKFSSQITDLNNPIESDGNVFETSSTFSKIPSQSPTPFNYLLLRIANLTLLRCRFLNEAVKKLFVKLLINKNSPIPLRRIRKIEFKQNTIHIADRIEKTSPIQIKTLMYGNKFSAIHMASARYFTPSQLVKREQPIIDIETLKRTGVTTQSLIIDLQKNSQVRLL